MAKNKSSRLIVAYCGFANDKNKNNRLIVAMWVHGGPISIFWKEKTFDVDCRFAHFPFWNDGEICSSQYIINGHYWKYLKVTS